MQGYFGHGLRPLCILCSPTTSKYVTLALMCRPILNYLKGVVRAGLAAKPIGHANQVAGVRIFYALLPWS